MTQKLSVCFFWHMHQPLYKDRLTGFYLMPWVRLHAIKDYMDMPLILEEFPTIRQTFNLVPSLIEQLQDYADGAVDEQLLLMCKDEATYTDKDKLYILQESFHCHLERQIKPLRPFFELFLKRERLLKHHYRMSDFIADFSQSEYGDMVMWMNLAWFDPYWRRTNQEIAALIDQGHSFTLAQRKRVIEIERELIRETIPLYRKLQDKQQIEVTTTPYYHPILPLLIDSNAGRWSAPYSALPSRLFFHRDDARRQLENGIALYEQHFGQKPRGMWPSEMSVSPAALELIAQSGIKWVVADDAILARTLDRHIVRDDHGNLMDAELLCQPYTARIGDEEVVIMFREVVLSNEIGFSYGSRDIEEAVSAFHSRLKHIQQRLLHWEREGVVTIALDGENCWETYEDDGNPFLRRLYQRLAEDDSLNVCTVYDYLQRNPPRTRLHNIHSGSWINSDFHIWIGDPYKNRAWDLLGQTRDFLVERLSQGSYPADVVAKAWEEIYTAEGSDWLWWFGEPNNSAHDSMFDEQFRLRLQNVYELLGEAHPEILDRSVYDHRHHR